MTKTLTKSIFFTAMMLFFISNISHASSNSLNNWPTKEKSARIIQTLYLQTQQELNTLTRSTRDILTRDRVVYLKRLVSTIKNSDLDPEDSFKNVHERHINQSGLSNEQIENYIKLADRIEEYINKAG